ncbi:hypothetical protein PCC8801_0118 [Rippkaea orientalis PCC 8801]|uniref:Uncharacterized protein n=1 Tax=Rippkaea orientalis (strain PCC 8801 / RF-1) TaxID=41431 RepID=B7K0S0_RIPO1|nr:hypothetical protein PCC8801_0118 [Rippkaea orientalis PCC 8801]
MYDEGSEIFQAQHETIGHTQKKNIKGYWRLL